jgi:hypothetical protein
MQIVMRMSAAMINATLTNVIRDKAAEIIGIPVIHLAIDTS